MYINPFFPKKVHFNKKKTMPTINQLFNNTRMKQPNKTRAPDLKKHPFKKGLCLKIFIRKPKKPNSALRKVARVKLSIKKEVTVYIPGQGHNLQGMPGVKYHLVRSCYDYRKSSLLKKKQIVC